MGGGWRETTASGTGNISNIFKFNIYIIIINIKNILNIYLIIKLFIFYLNIKYLKNHLYLF